MEHEGFPPEKTAVLVSAASRSGADWIERQPEERMEAYALFEAVKSDEEWKQAIATALEQGAECLAVAGGDGTLRRASRLIAETSKVLGIIPTGTGNAMAMEMGISPDPDEALLTISKAGEVRAVDLGDCEGEPFVNVVTLGLTAAIARELKNQPKGLLGKWAYLPAVLHAYQTAKPVPVKVTAGEKVFEGRAVQVVVAVTRNHGGPFATTPEAAHDDGMLCVYVAEAETRQEILVYASALLMGKHTDLSNVWSAEAKEVLVQPKMPRTFVIDGDRFHFSRATIRADKQAIRVYVPLSKPVETTSTTEGLGLEQ